jgi:hypothetical protein
MRQKPPPLTPIVRYFFDKQTFADTPIDYRSAPKTAVAVADR